jgi:hypothetical protein
MSVCKSQSGRAPNARVYLKALTLPFAVQLAFLFVLCMVEYDCFGGIPTVSWTLLRVLCWLGSVFGAFALQVYVLYLTPIFSQLSGRALRLLTIGAVSLPITLTGLVVGHGIFLLAGHGLLFD